MPKMNDRHHIMFSIEGMVFEYDEDKNEANIKKHGLPLSVGARVFFDDYRIEMDDKEHSLFEQRFDVIGSSVSGFFGMGNASIAGTDEVLFVVYTERDTVTQEGKVVEITRLISVRLANNFERGVYYANRR